MYVKHSAFILTVYILSIPVLIQLDDTGALIFTLKSHLYSHSNFLIL